MSKLTAKLMVTLGTGAVLLATTAAGAAKPATVTAPLRSVASYDIHGGYAAAGIGMRNLGYGTIAISGVPSHATVTSAFLLWDILGTTRAPAFAQGTFTGTTITGTAWAAGATPCWAGTRENFSYEANVTSLVAAAAAAAGTINTAYPLSGFATGQANGQDPWTHSTPPEIDGASLIVVYKLQSLPKTFIQIAAGGTETQAGHTLTATISGFTSNGGSADTTFVVGDGQTPYVDTGVRSTARLCPALDSTGAIPRQRQAATATETSGTP